MVEIERTWRDNLRPCGLYYEGFVDGETLNQCLEDHRRDTASTFGTRSSRLNTPCSTNNSQNQIKSENVCKYLLYYLCKMINN